MLSAMTRVWQVVFVVWSVALGLRAQQKPERSFQWVPVKIQASAFSPDLALLDGERDEYATNLADCAALAISSAKATQESLDQGQRLLTLALNLSPRNRRAIIVNYQLTKGLLPEPVKGDFSPPTMARLLLARGQILAKSNSQENRLLARMFYQVASELDPKNEDAVYASEVDRLDHGNLDWSFLTRPRGSGESPATPGEKPPEPPSGKLAEPGAPKRDAPGGPVRTPHLPPRP